MYSSYLFVAVPMHSSSARGLDVRNHDICTPMQLESLHWGKPAHDRVVTGPSG